MSLSDRRKFLALLAVLPLAGCGFTPAYAPGGAGDKLRGRVTVANPATRQDFEFATLLQARLGPPQAPVYSLKYDIATNPIAGGVVDSNALTRYTLNGTATYTLSATAGGTRVAGGTVRNFTSWSATGSTVAGIAAEDAATTRLLQMLADDIVSDLLAQLA